MSARVGIQISILFTENCLVMHHGLSSATAFISLICCTLTESVGIVYTWTRSALFISCSAHQAIAVAARWIRGHICCCDCLLLKNTYMARCLITHSSADKGKKMSIDFSKSSCVHYTNTKSFPLTLNYRLGLICQIILLNPL